MMNLLQLAAKMAVVEAELKLANEGAIAAACEIRRGMPVRNWDVSIWVAAAS